MKYFNPVEIIYTNSWLNELIDSQKNLGILNPIFVTSPGNRRRLSLDSVFNPDLIDKILNVEKAKKEKIFV